MTTERTEHTEEDQKTLAARVISWKPVPGQAQ
jgi:hypothetical protein